MDWHSIRIRDALYRHTLVPEGDARELVAPVVAVATDLLKSGCGRWAAEGRFQESLRRGEGGPAVEVASSPVREQEQQEQATSSSRMGGGERSGDTAEVDSLATIYSKRAKTSRNSTGMGFLPCESSDFSFITTMCKVRTCVCSLLASPSALSCSYQRRLVPRLQLRIMR